MYWETYLYISTGGEVGVAVAGVGGDILAEPGGGDEGVGGLGGGKLDFGEDEGGMGAVEDVELDDEAVGQGDAVAGLGDGDAFTFGPQEGVGLRGKGELLLTVVNGRGARDTQVLLDGEDIAVTHPADAQGG